MYYQDFCVEQIKLALNLGLTKAQLDSVAYKYALKSGLIRLYAETYLLQSSGKEFKFWDLNFGSRNWKGKYVWKALLCSVNAYNLCNNIEQGKVNFKSNKPYYEHIEPASLTYDKLIALNGQHASTNAIKAILDDSKLVVLAPGENAYLDSARYKFDLPDEIIINGWESKNWITNTMASEARNSMKKNGNYLSPKDAGTACARLAHLCRFGVQFKWNSSQYQTSEEIVCDYLRTTISHII